MVKTVSDACVRKDAVDGYYIYVKARNNHPGLKLWVVRSGNGEVLFSYNGKSWRYRSNNRPTLTPEDVLPASVIRRVEELGTDISSDDMIRRYNIEMEKRGNRARAVFATVTA